VITTQGRPRRFWVAGRPPEIFYRSLLALVLVLFGVLGKCMVSSRIMIEKFTCSYADASECLGERYAVLQNEY
jgi:hypothetical protein